MTVAARTARAKRGRVLLVGDMPALSQVLPQLQFAPNPPLQVNNFFDALGEVTIAPVAAPIATVIVADRSLNGGGRRAIESLRRLDPSIRIVVIAHDARGADAGACKDEWIKSGADDCVLSPVRTEDLPRLFDDDVLSPGSSVSIDAPEESNSPATAIAVEDRTDFSVRNSKGMVVSASLPLPPRMGVPLVIELDDDSQTTSFTEPLAQKRAEQPRQSSPQTPPTATNPATPLTVDAPAPSSTSDLGDTDLLDAVLTVPSRLAELALQLMIQQSGWTDLSVQMENECCATEVAAPSGETGSTVPIMHQGQMHGRLASAQASADQLRPWADWLAHWLAVDRAYHRCRELSLRDDLTSAWNRRFFDCFLGQAIAAAAKARRAVTVMVFDIDNFKTYNDAFGHDAGDDVLRETVLLLTSVIRQGDRVCRIGGDEFAVIFADPEGPREAGSAHPETVEVIAKRFQDQVCAMRFPKLGREAPGTLSISAGLATYPWDGQDAQALLRHADQLALQSKRSGKNAITFGPQAGRRER